MDGFINTNTINSHFKKIAKDADIRVVYKDIKRGKKTIRHKTSTVRTHEIRHTFGTRCAEHGMNLKALQTIMGHSDYTITENIYVSADNEFISKEMKKVEEELKVANLI